MGPGAKGAFDGFRRNTTVPESDTTTMADYRNKDTRDSWKPPHRSAPIIPTNLEQTFDSDSGSSSLDDSAKLLPPPPSPPSSPPPPPPRTTTAHDSSDDELELPPPMTTLTQESQPKIKENELTISPKRDGRFPTSASSLSRSDLTPAPVPRSSSHSVSTPESLSLRSQTPNGLSWWKMINADLVLEGYLSKQSSRGLKPFQKRYFVFDESGRQIFYYKDETAKRDEPVGTIDLKEVKECSHTKDDRLKFEIISSKRTYMMQAPSPVLSSRWVTHINRVVRELKEPPPSTPVFGRQSVVEVKSKTAPIFLEAMLKKKNPRRGSLIFSSRWQDRWFVLDQNTMSICYYRNNPHTSPGEKKLATILLRDVAKCKTDFSERDKPQFNIWVKTGRQYCICCPKESEASKWAASVNKCIGVNDGYFASYGPSLGTDKKVNTLKKKKEGAHLVIDNGSCNIRAGYAGESYPSVAVPQNSGSILDPKAQSVGSEGKTVIQFDKFNQFIDDPKTWSTMEATWRSALEQLRCDPTEHHLIVTLPLCAPKYIQENMERLCFEKLKVPAMHLAPASVLAAYSYGRFTGLVVDIGHSCATVCPIVEGFLKETAVRRVVHLGGEALTRRMYEFLQFSSLSSMPVEEALKICQIIKEKYCFCALGDYQLAEKDPKNKATHILPSGESVTVLKALANVGETYFQPKVLYNDKDESISSIQEMIAESIAASELDTRTELLENILLSGGGTMMRGFKKRLEIELKNELPHAAESIKIFSDKDRMNAVWRGASVLAKLDMFQNKWKRIEEWVVEKEMNSEKLRRQTTTSKLEPSSR